MADKKNTVIFGSGMPASNSVQIPGGMNHNRVLFASDAVDWGAVNLTPSALSIGIPSHSAVISPVGLTTQWPGSLIQSPRERTLESEIGQLRAQLTIQSSQLTKEKKESETRASLLEEATRTMRELRGKEAVSFVLHRIHPDARDLLLSSEAFKERLLGNQSCDAFVLSVDIRRSTELMLKAKTPQMFAQFLTVLAAKLREIVLSNHGVFDKFTGDGILAFFPDFYSGEDAGIRAITAAAQCHAVFADLYAANRSCFRTIPMDTGLGIGIDYGDVSLVQVGDGLTVVGTPVVYACRMSGAPAGVTLLNQPAFEQLFGAFSALCTFDETEFAAKHEGPHLAYAVSRNSKSYEPKPPAWQSFDDKPQLAARKTPREKSK